MAAEAFEKATTPAEMIKVCWPLTDAIELTIAPKPHVGFKEQVPPAPCVPRPLPLPVPCRYRCPVGCILVPTTSV